MFQGYTTLLLRFVRRLIRIKPVIILAMLTSLLDYFCFSNTVGLFVQQFLQRPYAPFALSGILVGYFAIVSIRDASFNLLLMRFDGSMRSLLASPVTGNTLVLALLSSAWLRSLVSCLPLLAIYFYSVRLGLLPIVSTFYILLMICLISSSIGVVDGTRARSFQSCSAISTQIFNTMAYLSGGTFIIAGLPQNSIIRIVAKFNPFYYVVQALRGSLSVDGDLPSLVFLGILSVITVMFVVTAGLYISKRSNLTTLGFDGKVNPQK